VPQTQLNALCAQFGERLAIVACPCNQFGNQENVNGEEIYSSLMHIRPGNGYTPNFPLAKRLEVNGAGAHDLFKFLRFALPERSDTGFAAEADAPIGVQKSALKVGWTPSNPTDIVWNFEKFLLDCQGKPIRRYSPKFETIKLTDEISALLG
jgi:glutathione peroxidase